MWECVMCCVSLWRSVAWRMHTGLRLWLQLKLCTMCLGDLGALLMQLLQLVKCCMMCGCVLCGEAAISVVGIVWCAYVRSYAMSVLYAEWLCV